MVNELRTSITQQVIRKDTGDKLQAFAISMFFKGKSNQSSRIQVYNKTDVTMCLFDMRFLTVSQAKNKLKLELFTARR